MKKTVKTDDAAHLEESQWMTRTEAALWLRLSVDSVDRDLIPMAAGRQPGKLRYVRMNGRIPRIRILAEDVFAILPRQEEAA